MIIQPLKIAKGHRISSKNQCKINSYMINTTNKAVYAHSRGKTFLIKKGWMLILQSF